MQESLPFELGRDKPLFIVGFTGHRPPKVGGYKQPNPIATRVKNAMLDQMAQLQITYGDTHEIVIVWGGALGVDQWAGQMANHLGIRHCLVIPFKGFQSRWPQESQLRLKALAASTDKELAEDLLYRYGNVVAPKKVSLTHIGNAGVLTCYNDSNYYASRMQDRNMVMVDISDYMIAVWDGSKGGTANCVGYIKRQDKGHTIVDPNTYMS